MIELGMDIVVNLTPWSYVTNASEAIETTGLPLCFSGITNSPISTFLIVGL